MKVVFNREKIIFIILEVMVFLLPLFFIPLTASVRGMDNFNKNYLLWFGAGILFLLYFLPMLWRGKIIWQKTGLELPLAFWSLIIIISSFLAISPAEAVFGYYGRELTPLFSFLSLAVIFLVILQTIKDKKAIGVLWRFFIFSYAIVSTLAFFLFSFWRHNNILSIFFRHFSGSPEDFAVFSAIMFVSVLAVLKFSSLRQLVLPHKLTRFFVAVSLFFAAVNLIIIDFLVAWWLLFVGIVTIFIARFFWQEKKPQKINWRQLFIALLLVFFPVNFLLNNYLVAPAPISADRLVANLQLPLTQTYVISYRSLKARPFFGNGPESWPYVFSRFRDKSLNKGQYWNIRYQNPSGYFPALMAETGFVGLLGFWGFIIIYFYSLFVFLKKQNNIAFKQILFSLFLVVFLLFALMFFHPYNAVLFFMWWFFMAITFAFGLHHAPVADKQIVAIIPTGKQKEKFKYFLFVLGGVLLALFWFLAFGWALRFYAAEYLYRSYPKNINAFKKATSLNTYGYNYNLALARLYQARAMMLIESREAEKIKQAEKDINNAISQAKIAVNRAPFAVTAYETIGTIYRDIAPYADSGANQSIRSFSAAAKLEPTNPVIMSELGKAYATGKYFDQAKQSFQKAIELKADYLPARLGLAKVYGAEGNNQEAIKELQSINNSDDANIESIYELGRAYFNNKNYALAATEFEKALSKNPLYLNALYSLGLSYEKLKEFDLALYYFKRAQKQAPNNTQISQKINEIKKILIST